MERLEKEIHKRLYNYETGTDYTPLEITMSVTPPVYISSPWIHLDGIIGYLCTRDALDDLFYLISTDKTIDTSMLDLPFKQTEDVNHSSVGQYDSALLYKDTIYKRFTDKEIDCLNPKLITPRVTKRKGKTIVTPSRIQISRGYFKDFMIDLPMLLTDEIRFYCNADKAEMKRLLPNLKAVGKKTSIGSGFVQSINIHEISEDYSFFKDNRVMRPIPTKIQVPFVKGLVISYLPYKPPYWSKSNLTMCASPESQIKIGE